MEFSIKPTLEETKLVVSFMENGTQPGTEFPVSYSQLGRHKPALYLSILRFVFISASFMHARGHQNSFWFAMHVSKTD